MPSAPKRRRPAKTDQYRFVVYLPRERFLQLKSKLAAEGMTISAWGRKVADAKIDGAKA
jgi:hypothetical protein